MNLTSNDETFTSSKLRGKMNIMGNNNTIDLTQCQLLINVSGNGNTFHLTNSKMQIKITGNGNILQLNNTILVIGFKGNGNQIKDNQHKCQIIIMSNQGSYNTFPPSAIKNDNSKKNNNNMQKNKNKYSFIPNQMNYNPRLYPQQAYNEQFPQPLLRFGKQPPPSYSNDYPNNIKPISNNKNINLANREKKSNTRNNNNNQNCLRPNPQFQNNMNQQSYQPFLDRRNPSRNRLINAYNNKNINKNEPIPNRNNRYPNSMNDDQFSCMNIQDEYDNYHERIPPINQFQRPPNMTSTRRFNFNQFANQLRYAFNENDDIRGLTEQQVNKLKSSKYSGKIMNCSICLDDICQGNDVLFLFCFHSYHSKCVKSWLKKSAVCPLCQLDITTYLQ